MTAPTKRPTVLITGGSSGLGLALAHHYARRGHRLVLVAWPEQELANVQQTLTEKYGVPVITRGQDLCLPGAGKALFTWYQKQAWSVDLLINNAGIGLYGSFHQLDAEQEEKMLALNLHTNHQLTRLFAAEMVARNQGTLVTIASQAAYTPSPYLATYAATKAFLLHYYRAIQTELKREKSKVRALAICPPPMRTQFARRANMEGHRLFRSWLTVPTERVAKITVRAIDRGRQGYIPGWYIRWTTHLLNRMLPADWKAPVTAKFLQPKK